MHQTIRQTCSSCGNSSSILIDFQNNPTPICPICGESLGIAIEEVKGFVYVLSNKAMPGILKIGFTDVDVFNRCRELGKSTGVPIPFEVEAYFVSNDARSLEQQLHSHFAECRLDPNREFFTLELDELLREIKSNFSLSPDYLHTDKRTQEQSSQADKVDEEPQGIAHFYNRSYSKHNKGPNYQIPPRLVECPNCNSRYHDEWIERCRSCRTKLLDVPPLSYSNLSAG